jgi:riboflavin kinase / FMN adenylyltransferase
MLVLRRHSTTPSALRGSVMALGNFDGLHLGHQAVLNIAKKAAAEQNMPLTVMTFTPHPRRFFNPQLPPLAMMSLSEKLQALREFGVEAVWVMRFDKAFSQLTADQFVDELLVQKIGVKQLVTGENFVFGYQRQGNLSFLQQKKAQGILQHQPVPPLMVAGDICSSTRLRQALQSADMEHAAQLLGRPYTMTGRVIKGDQRGRLLGYPTANLAPGERFLPAFGIYAATLETGDTRYHAVASLGLRPMYALQKPLLETHVFDASPNLYGKKVRVALHHYLRPEMHFDSEAALISQMNMDSEKAKDCLKDLCF